MVKGGPISIGDSNMTEMIGLLERLRMSKARGHKDCIVEGDSKTAISWGKATTCGSWRLNHFIQEIRDLVMEVQACLRDIPQSQNSTMDLLAKWSAHQQGVFVSDYIPE